MNARPAFDDLVLRGLSAKEISQLIGIEPTQIYKMARKRGLNFNRNRTGMILDALAEGMETSNEIAASFGGSVSRNAVRARLSQLARDGLVEVFGERARTWPQPCVRWRLAPSCVAWELV
jgi:predicted ArsR family transcriptional regulator